MKCQTPGSDDQISQKRDEENPIVSVLHAVVHAFERQEDEQQIRQAVDDLGGIMGSIVILEM